MWRGNHARITREALRGEGLKKQTLEFIVGSNRDADDSPTGSHHIPQHFQNNTNDLDSARSIVNADAFRFKAMHNARKLICEGGQENITNGLYFLGRALHCIQDFYAHSNWIFLRQPSDVWYGNIYPDLYLCYLTPRGNQWLNLQKPLCNEKKKYNIKEKKDRKEWLETIKSKPVYHPDIHLDIERSWASRCYKMLFEDQPHNGYTTAKTLAILHTIKVWDELEGGIGMEGRNCIRTYEVPRGQSYSSWNALRKKFDNDMGI